MGGAPVAASVMQQAIFEFSGSAQEGRVTVANAQLEVEGGDVERALSMLRGVAPGSAHYLAARTALADLYLTYRSDRRMYALCHEEVVKANPSVHSFGARPQPNRRRGRPARSRDSHRRAQCRSARRT